MSQGSEMRRTLFQGSGIDSQGTKWFGTWELLQVKLSALPTERPRFPLAQTGSPCVLRILTQACRPPCTPEPCEAHYGENRR